MIIERRKEELETKISKSKEIVREALSQFITKMFYHLGQVEKIQLLLYG